MILFIDQASPDFLKIRHFRRIMNDQYFLFLYVSNPMCLDALVLLYDNFTLVVAGSRLVSPGQTIPDHSQHEI